MAKITLDVLDLPPVEAHGIFLKLQNAYWKLNRLYHEKFETSIYHDKHARYLTEAGFTYKRDTFHYLNESDQLIELNGIIEALDKSNNDCIFGCDDWRTAFKLDI